MEGLLVILALGFFICAIVLPIVAIVRTGRISELEARIARLEAMGRTAIPYEPPPLPVAPPEPRVIPPAPQPQSVPVAAPAFTYQPPPSGENLELMIGRRWSGIAAIALIVIATAFFLKYAFENRWIGELGRVTLGIIAGLVLLGAGYRGHTRSSRYLAQLLTAGGIVILYLSVYGAFGYYHLIGQTTAFIVLAVLVAEAHLLAMAYRAPLIAVLALIGGFLVPVLLSTGRDNYTALFTYLVILDLGMLGAVFARGWRGIGSLGYVGTQLLFWAWYSEHYHPEKRAAALVFQLAIFLIFAAADLAPNLRHRAATWEEWVRLAVNPFVFFATCYGLLDRDYHDWMAVEALVLAALYAAMGRTQLRSCPEDVGARLVTIGTALTFVTLAIPIQLDSNWITIAWSVEAAAVVWAAGRTGAEQLRILATIVFVLALGRFLLDDTPWASRAVFTPVFNRYFLGMLVLAVSLVAAAWTERQRPAGWPIAMLAFGVFWLGSSVEAYTYFAAQANAVSPRAADVVETVRRLMWTARMSLSLLWSAYAGALTAAGFRFRLRPLRVAGLVLFGITLGKVLLVDLAELREFYRIVAVLLLGLVLLGVAWKYQRTLRREQNS